MKKIISKFIFILILITALLLTVNKICINNEEENDIVSNNTIDEIILPKYIEDETLDAINTVEELSNDNTISFGFITDLHVDVETISSITNVQAFRKIGTSLLMDFMMCAGDITTGLYDDLYSGKGLYNLQYFSNVLSNTNSLVLYARGNHDCNSRTSEDVAISGVQYYETVLSQLDGKVIFNENDLGGDYYYKDLEDKKIRVCVLNAFNGSNYEFIFGDEQLNFVANEVLDLSGKEDQEEWQVLFITHTVDTSSAHDEAPSDRETLYSILNAFQEAAKETIGNISVDYTNQSKGTVIAIITGHHHMDTTTIKNNLLIITVRSASGLNDRDGYHEEEYNKDDVSFDIFTIDTETKTIYSTKVGRGNDRSWSYDINNLKELNNVQRVRTNVADSSVSGIEVNYITDWNNNVVAIVQSDSDFVEKTNQTWKLSEDKKTYIKVLDDITTSQYTTTFKNINGDVLTYTFNLDELTDTTGPELTVEYQKDDNGIVTAIVTSDEILKTKSNTDWSISQNRLKYEYILKQGNDSYVTTFSDVFKNTTTLTLQFTLP